MPKPPSYKPHRQLGDCPYQHILLDDGNPCWGEVRIVASGPNYISIACEEHGDRIAYRELYKPEAESKAPTSQRGGLMLTRVMFIRRLKSEKLISGCVLPPRVIKELKELLDAKDKSKADPDTSSDPESSE